MENPFRFGDVVTGKYFTDRERETRSLVDDLSSGQNVLLFSPRRYGKTSLVFKVFDVLKTMGIVPVYIDLYKATSLDGLVKRYASAITKASASKVQEAIAFVQKNFPAITPHLTFKGPGASEIELDFDSPKRDETLWLENIFDMPQKLAAKQKKRWVVVLDEFQEVGAIQPAGVVERSLRSIIQHHERVAYVFMGSRRHLLDGLFLDKNKPLYRIAKPMTLERIDSGKLKTFVISRFKDGGIDITEEMAEKILSLTGCHPYYTQFLCHEVYRRMEGEKNVSERIIQEGVADCIKMQSYAYTTIWDGLSGRQRDVVLGLAGGGKSGVFSKEFISRNDLGTPATVQRAVKMLIQKDVIERENGHFVLADVFFSEWVKRKAT